MMIEEIPLRYWIDNFYGYGSWQAPFWFVGYEESGGDVPEEVAEKISYFHSAVPDNSSGLCDIRELYRHVAFRIDGPRAERFATLHDQRFGPRATLHGGWKNIIAFVHGWQQMPLPDLLAYQKESLASASSPREALLQLYPLPAHNHAWYYSWLNLPQLPFLRSRSHYQQHVFPTRIRILLKKIVAHRPQVVVMYGMDNINLLKEAFLTHFPSARFKMIKAIKQLVPQHHRAELAGTTLIITTQIPALRHNRIESGFDWYEFGTQAQTGG